MLDFLISLGLWGCIKQIKDALVLWLDDYILRQKELKCPVCLGMAIWKDGHERRKCRLPVQRYFCPGCGRSFCINTLAPWYWHKYSPASIVLFLWLMLSGESILKARSLCSFSRKMPTWKTLWQWLLKFGSIVVGKCAGLQPKVSRYRAWQNDEAYLRDMPVIGTVDPWSKRIFLSVKWNANAKSLYSHMRRVITKWKKKPRGWWTDEWKAYHKALKSLAIPHNTIKHRDWQFKNSKGVTTNAIENVWRQMRRYLQRRNGLKHQAYVPFHVGLFEAKYNSVRDSRQMIEMLC